MYIIFPFTGFIQDSCTDTRRACVAALCPAVSPPCCIQRRWGCYPRKASNVPSDAFRLGLVKNSSGWNTSRKNWGKLNQERYAPVCVFVPCSGCRAARFISRKCYLLFASNVACRWPETETSRGFLVYYQFLSTWITRDSSRLKSLRWDSKD